MEMDSLVVKTEATQNEDISFTCDGCQAVFNSNDSLEKHCLTCGENKPRENKPRVCLWCHLMFMREKELTEHQLTAHQQETETEHELTAHKLTAHQQETETEHELTAHQEETEAEVKDEENFHLKEPSAEREEVRRKNKGEDEKMGLNDINHHGDLPKETEKKPHVCEQCSVAFVDLQSFVNHMDSHTVSPGILCPVCSAVFQWEHDLNRHVFLHAQNNDTKHVKMPNVTLIHSKLDSSKEKLSSTLQQEVVLPSVGQAVPLHKASKPHHCEMCGKSFTSKSGLRKHERRHCGNDTVQICTKCGETFKTKPQLDTHVLKTHSTENFETMENLLDPGFPESEDSTGQNHYQCEMCNKSFSSRSGLTRHQVSHRTDKSFFCHLCGKRFKRKSHLQRHELTHDKRTKHEKSYSCEKCDKHFTEKAGLKRHEFVHRDEKPHKCEKCEESFTRKDSLMQHMVKKHDQVSHIPDVNKYMIENACATIHQCDECDKSFAYKPFLTQHKLQQHIGKNVIGSGTFLCDVCLKSFFSKASLTKHLLIHNAEKSHQCDQCHKLFLRKYQLKDHMRTHTGEKPHICDQCGKAFGFMSDMKKHQVSVHSDVKSHKCEHCERRFSHRTQLNKHMAKHSTGEASQCDQCNKLFPHEILLKKHMMTHVKPFHCTFCDKSFYSKNHLKQHVPMHTGEKAFRCNMCGKSFGHNASLSNHKRKSCPKRPVQE